MIKDLNRYTNSDLKKIVDKIRLELNGVEAIYLFGSMAKGTQNENSDYDITIIVNESPKNELDIVTKIRLDLLGKIKRPLDIIILDLNDLNYSFPFLYELYHYNRLLFGSNVLEKAEGAVRKMKPIVRDGRVVAYHVG